MRYLFVILLGLFTLPIHASVKVDVFKAEVVLDENQSDAEEFAREQGFKEVIIKASGDKESVDNAVIKKALSNTSSYLSQLGYGDKSGQQTLQMVFNPVQIENLLGQADLPYWVSNRSNVLVWVIQEGQYGREILWEYSDEESIEQISEFAALRGLPVVFPVGDIEDITNISGPDLWGEFIEPISTASKRYPVDAVLIIKVQQASDGGYVRWSLYDEKPEFMVNSKREPIAGVSTGDINSALEVVIDEVSNHYAEKSAIKSSGYSDNMMLAQFSGLTSSNDFFELEKWLITLNSVADIEAIKVIGNSVTFEVYLLGTEIDFETEVVQNGRVRKVDTASESLFLNEAIDGESTLDEVSGESAIDGISESGASIQESTSQGDEQALESETTEPSVIKTAVFEWID